MVPVCRLWRNLRFSISIAALVAALLVVPLVAIHGLDAASALQGFHVGDAVEVRNHGEDWTLGEVISISPLKVKRAQDWLAHKWDDVRLKVPEAITEPHGSPDDRFTGSVTSQGNIVRRGIKHGENHSIPLVRRDGRESESEKADQMLESLSASDDSTKDKLRREFMDEEDQEEDEADREFVLAMKFMLKKKWSIAKIFRPPPPPTPAPEAIAGHGCYVSEENFLGKCYKKCSTLAPGYPIRIGKNLCAKSRCNRNDEEMLEWSCYRKCELWNGGVFGVRTGATKCSKADGSSVSNNNQYNRRGSDGSRGYPAYVKNPNSDSPGCSGYNVNRFGTCPGNPPR